MTVLRELAWHHPHLYIPCDAQFALYTLLSRRCLFQLVVGRLQVRVGLLQLFVHAPQPAGIQVPTPKDEGEGEDDECSDGNDRRGEDPASPGGLFLRCHLRLVFADLQVLVMLVEAVVLQPDGGILQLHLLVLQVQLQRLFLQPLLLQVAGQVLQL